MKLNLCKSIKSLSAITCIGAAFLMSPSNCFAYDNTGFTFSAAYGGYKSRGGEFDDDNDLYELSVGYRFLPFLGVEAGYTDLGTFGGDLASAKVDGFSASLVGILPLTESFHIYAEAGQFFSNTEVSVLDFTDSMDDQTLFYGVGASFLISEPLWVNIEYQRYKIEVDDNGWPVELSDEDTDIDAIKVGALFKF